MARILGGGTFGQLSGKMGGLVFARNRAGNYIRSFVKPIDPKTIAQLSARNNFGVSSSNYHGLTDDLKAMWEEFANSTFVGRNGIQGNSSGFNAFLSLLNVCQIKPRVFPATIKFDETQVTGGTAITPVFSTRPPTSALEANFATTGGKFYPYNFSSLGLFVINVVDGEYSIDYDFKLGVTKPIGTTGNITSFTDAKGNDFLFNIYMSNPVAQRHMFVQNPYKYLIAQPQGKTGFTSTTVPDLVTITGVGTPGYSGDYKAFPQTNDWVKITIFAISSTGMMLRIGSDMVQLT